MLFLHLPAMEQCVESQSVVICRVNRKLEVSLLRLENLFRFEIDGLPSLHCIDLSILAMHTSLQEICVQCRSTSSKYFHLALKVPQLKMLSTEVSDDYDDLTAHWRDEVI